MQKGAGVWASLPWMNPVSLCNILAKAVDSKPAWANVIHGFLPTRKVHLCGLLSWPLFGGMISI